MVAKSEDIIAKHKDVFDKILKHVEQEYPKASRKVLFNIARRWTKTWVDFNLDPSNKPMPSLSLFKILGELSNFGIQGVTVDYISEPSIIMEYVYKGVKYSSYSSYDEAETELEFALNNSIAGVEKLRSTMERLETEMIDTRKIRKVGNSLVVSIPESIVSLFNLKIGDYVSFIYRFGEVKLKKTKPEV